MEIKWWYFHGKLHRIGGPAIEYANGSKKWCVDGELHRLDGPAVEYVENEYFQDEWWINSHNVTQTQHSEFIYLIKKRERKIQFKTVRRWTDWLMDPNTERGCRHIERQYQRMMEIN